ncbi:MAG: nuclear transport factor 2 family protein [Betaproteobacteria bacterium]|nr:nuclear transport factor 2 family protein [Betaproteobacteria bacterium]
MVAFMQKIIFAMLLGLVAQGAQAGDVGLEQVIGERLAVLEKAWGKGDAKTITTQVWGSDAVIHGEGQTAVVNTPEGVLETIEHLLADTRKVKLDVYTIRGLGPDAALSWVTWHVTPKTEEKPFEVRSLFVWTRGKEGWRIRADMYSMGAM